MINWLTTNWSQISSVLVTVIILARLVVKLLPNPKAGTTLEHFVDILKHLGLHIDNTPTPPTPPPA